MSDISCCKLQLLINVIIVWNINCINVLRANWGGQNLSPTDIHKCSTSSNCNTWILYYFFLMWTIHNEYIPCCSHQSIALGSVCLKESSSSDSDVGTSLEGVCRLFGPALPWHTYHSFRLVTWGERFDERFLWGSRFGERASPIVVDEGW